MNEFGHSENQSDEVIINRNYLSSDNVRARFELYNFSDPAIDIEELTIGSLALRGDETVVDIGAADGSLLQRMQVEFGHHGRLIGVEPNFSQVESTPIWKPLDKDMVVRGLNGAVSKLKGLDSTPKFMEELAANLSRDASDNIELLEGDANHIPLPDTSADVLLAMFMLYHVPTHKQHAALDEFKRVLRPDGVFVMATSDGDNKRGHRFLEDMLAQRMGILKPKEMNSGFTTEKAVDVVPNHFRHTYVFSQLTRMVIDSPYKAMCYLNSLRSLRDQFQPIPLEEDFEAHLQMVVAPILARSLRLNGAFIDQISRSVIIGSDRILKLDPSVFREIG
jgi:ubiquinone/menaquinone biosynthesis C-methylase UbiE